MVEVCGQARTEGTKVGEGMVWTCVYAGLEIMIKLAWANCNLDRVLERLIGAVAAVQRSSGLQCPENNTRAMVVCMLVLPGCKYL